MKKIAADNIPRRPEATAIGELDHRGVRIGVRVWRVRLGWIDSDVMTPEALDQLALRRDRPFFQMRGQPVSIRQEEIRKRHMAEPMGAFGDTDQAGDYRCQRRG